MSDTTLFWFVLSVVVGGCLGLAALTILEQTRWSIRRQVRWEEELRQKYQDAYREAARRNGR